MHRLSRGCQIYLAEDVHLLQRGLDTEHLSNLCAWGMCGWGMCGRLEECVVHGYPCALWGPHSLCLAIVTHLHPSDS